jgi:putative endonuclease
MNKTGYIYIVTNEYRTTLYIGVTSNLIQRIEQHKNGEGSFFTNKYQLKYLVYFEEFPTIEEAILREKQLKGLKRHKKNDLIVQFNPTWKDLYDMLIGEIADRNNDKQA